MVYNRLNYSASVVIRLLLILLSLIGLSYLLVVPGYYASILSLLIVVTLQTYELLKFTSKTNTEINRFLAAARYADYGQRFNFQELGSGFGELGSAFSEILSRLQKESSIQEKERVHLKALVEHAPVPLLSVHDDGQITVWNRAARQLFAGASIIRLADLRPFSERLAEQLRSVRAGDRVIAWLTIDGIQQQFALMVTQISIDGKTEKLISLQNIQSELELVQSQAWQDLVRVLTHEVMNSVTPVISLANTTLDLVDDVASKLSANDELSGDMANIRHAVNTVAQRSDHLIRFIASYRQLTNLPEPTEETVGLEGLFQQVKTLLLPTWEQKGLNLVIEIEPAHLELVVDSAMFEQVLLNLLSNAEHALGGQPDATVWLRAYRDKRGRVIVEVADNGVGIAPGISDKIFVPFFTTRQHGSGVGLALVRQIMMVHGGSVSQSEREGGGALFALVF